MPFMHLVLVKLHIWALQLTHRDMVAGRPESTPLSVYIFHSAHKLLLWDVFLSYFLSLVVLFLPLVFTVHHCLSQMVIFRRGKHLGWHSGPVFGGLGTATITHCSSHAQPKLDKWQKLSQTHCLSNREGGRNWKAEWIAPTARFSAHWNHVFSLS